MTKEGRDKILVVCARMRFASDGPDVRRFCYNDVDAVRVAFEQLAQYVDTLEAERDAIALKCDGRPAAFLSLLEDRAKKLEPDYPWSKHDAFEWLWAITSGSEGTTRANYDWVALQKKTAAERDAARAVLRQVEWKGGEETDSCPRCGHMESSGHAADCALAAALGGRR